MKQEYLIRSIKVDRLKDPGLNMTEALRLFLENKKPNQELLSINHFVDGEDTGGITNMELLETITTVLGPEEV